MSSHADRLQQVMSVFKVTSSGKLPAKAPVAGRRTRIMPLLHVAAG
jgi:hypothetical protein